MDCFILLSDEIREIKNNRLIETDNLMGLPINSVIRFCFNSADVIHNWSIPQLGLKFDCNPGIFRVCSMSFSLLGIFRGACAELCGAGHSFIPINIDLILFNSFYF